jgi:hypothetical protein
MRKLPALASLIARVVAPVIAVGVLAAAAHASGPAIAEDAASWAPAWSLAGPWQAAHMLRYSLDFLDGALTLPLGEGLRTQASLGRRPGSDPMNSANGSDHRREPWLQTGLRWTATADRLFIDGGIGARTSGPHPVTLTLGLKVAL